MKPLRSVLIFCCALLFAALPVFGQNAAVRVDLYPNPVQVNGAAYDVTWRPLLRHMMTVYIPLDDNFKAALGLSVVEDKDTVSIKTGGDVKAMTKPSAPAPNPKDKTVMAEKLSLTVKVDDKEMKWRQPMLRYGNVLYMPVDWSIATKVFGWTYTETKATGFLLGGPKFVATHRQAVALGVIENRAKKNPPIPAVSSAIVHSRQTVAVGQRNIACEVVTVDMKAGGLQAETVLAGGAIGKTGTLEAAAKANGALFAINGTFFDAYNGYGTPSNVLVSQGKLVTTGGYYGALGINGTQAKVDRVQALVDGENTGKVFDYVSWYNGKWYGLSLNTPHIHFGDSRIVLFDCNHHGKIKTHKGFVGYYFTVNQGIISEPKKVTSEIDHKADYTIVFPATVSHPNLDINTVAKDPKLLNTTQHVYSNYAKFAQGATFGAQPVVTNIKDIGDRKQLEKTDPFWKTVETVVGAGPLLVKGGKNAIDFTQESFGEKKITTDSGRRSVAGIKADGTLIFVIADGTVDELAEVMIRLGAVDATCFDGGGSSGMYLNGKTIVQPGRELSNILIFKGK